MSALRGRAGGRLTRAGRRCGSDDRSKEILVRIRRKDWDLKAGPERRQPAERRARKKEKKKKERNEKKAGKRKKRPWECETEKGSSSRGDPENRRGGGKERREYGERRLRRGREIDKSSKRVLQL